MQKDARFISLEGVDGCGKSSLLKSLCIHIINEYRVEVVVTKEPGASLRGSVIREMLFTDQPGPGAAKMYPGQADALLLYDHIGNSMGVVAPALAAGKWVLCDRYADSQFAYSVAKPHSKAINEAYAKHFGPIPDVTFLLIGDVAEFNARAKSRDLQPDALEPGKQQGKIWASVDQQRRIQDAYLHHLSNQPRTVILDITGLDQAAVLRLAIGKLTLKLLVPQIPVMASLFQTVQ